MDQRGGPEFFESGKYYKGPIICTRRADRLFVGGGAEFFGVGKGGQNVFSVGQRGDQNFLRVKERGTRIFPNFFFFAPSAQFLL